MRSLNISISDKGKSSVLQRVVGLTAGIREGFNSAISKMVEEQCQDTSDDPVWEGHGLHYLPKPKGGVKNYVVKISGNRYSYGMTEYNCSQCNNIHHDEGARASSTKPKVGAWTKHACKCDELPRCSNCLQEHLNQVWNRRYHTSCKPTGHSMVFGQYRKGGGKKKSCIGSCPGRTKAVVKCECDAGPYCYECYYKHYCSVFEN